MNPETLRALQAPLKERYRDTPEAALVTLRAQGRLGDGVSCRIETGKALVEAGLHPATGGSGQAACSGDMLLEALVACAGVTLNAVATALGIELRDATLQAEGDLDFRGTLGVAKEAPVGFRNIRLNFTLDTDASEEQLATLLRLTERYCVVYQTLAHPPALAVSRKRAGRD
ncbi:OsmC family protein [Azospira restricta]|uniref:OsmC family protein n=1 Tax=Azospira restricta TaxID=404405 RepID=A0A974PVQ0_9RHOO|nr:OsmC family protein [Azospira restricta]QRJ62382.1 OsmC family protein [Azospira restricta]